MTRMVVLASVLAASPAHADPHVTFEAGIGGGGVTTIHDNPRDMPVTWGRDALGTTPLSVGAGEFVTPALAISARLVHGSYMIGDWGTSARFVGACVQYWPTQQLWVGGGVGVMSGAGSSDDTRFHGGLAPALELRVGAPVLRRRSFTLNLSLEYTPALYTKRFDGDRTAIVGLCALALGIQLM